MSTLSKKLTHVVSTTSVRWTVISRIVVVMGLLLPLKTRIVELCGICSITQPPVLASMSQALAFLLLMLEVACVASYCVGGLTRLFLIPTTLILATRAISGFMTLWPDFYFPGIVARGDWVLGAMYLGVLTIVMDLNDIGSGYWSVDYLLMNYLRIRDASTVRPD